MSMDKTAKRELYACKKDFLTLDGIKPWAQYARDNDLKSSIR
jgi:hypothetical protein